MSVEQRIAVLRGEIDRLDDALVDLLERRVRTAEAIGRLKASVGIPLRALTREAEILQRVPRTLGPVFEVVIAESRRAQRYAE